MTTPFYTVLNITYISIGEAACQFPNPCFTAGGIRAAACSTTNEYTHFAVSVHWIVPQHFRCLTSNSMSFNAFLRAWLLPSPAFE